MADETSIEIYDALAGEYERSRPAEFADRAASLAARSPGVIIDLGCGPGAYLEHLGDRVVGLDASEPMLELARHHGRPLVRADLERLPFRPGSAAAGWARNTYLHIDHGRLPMALRELHRLCAVGAPVEVALIGGPDDHVVSSDNLPGRSFWRSTDQTLIDLFAGAGFEDVSVSPRPVFVTARRARSLPDTVGDEMDVLVCGLNPSLHAADAGVGFVTANNRFWPAAQAAQLVGLHRSPEAAYRLDRVGMTHLVKRATTKANELEPAEYREGIGRLERLCARHRPAVACMVGLAGWRAAVDRRAKAGWQERRLADTSVYVMPSTSGLNAHARLEDLTEHLLAVRAGV